MVAAMTMPQSIALGNTRAGSLVSSAMLTESSKPTIEKNASEVADVIATSMVWSWVLNSTRRLGSPAPFRTAQAPTPMMISRPPISMHVNTTLVVTDSRTPRKLMTPSSAMNRIAMSGIGEVMNSAR
ncbi:hypothetical protein ACZ91_40915 [Streptomyces regensis]|nr:hypothetical protein ACZ91_40915 [Streptomyces regensis]